MGSNSEENIKFEHIADCRVSEELFTRHSLCTIFQHSYLTPLRSIRLVDRPDTDFLE